MSNYLVLHFNELHVLCSPLLPDMLDAAGLLLCVDELHYLTVSLVFQESRLS